MNYILVLILGIIVGYWIGACIIAKAFLVGVFTIDETDPTNVRCDIKADKDLDEIADKRFALFKVVHKKSQNNIPL